MPLLSQPHTPLHVLLLDPVLRQMVLKYVLRSYIYFFLHNHHQYETKISFVLNVFKTTYIMHQIMLHMNPLAPFTQWSLLIQMPHPLIGQDQKWTSHQSTATVSGHHDKMRLPTWVLAGLCCNGYNKLSVKRNIEEDVQRKRETQRRSWWVNQKEWGSFEDLGVDDTTIMKCILKK